MNELMGAAQQLADPLPHLSGLKKWPRADQRATAHDVAKAIVRQEGLTETQAEEAAQRLRYVVTTVLAQRSAAPPR